VIIKLRNHYSLGKSAKTKSYEKSFSYQLKSIWKNINYEGQFGFVMSAYFASNRPDLDNALKVILDCLQKDKVIKNDNKCMFIFTHKEIDKDDPRVEFTIIPIDNGDNETDADRRLGSKTNKGESISRLQVYKEVLSTLNRLSTGRLRRRKD
jgi:Holliday junction resolvase RusA-like endonuclease